MANCLEDVPEKIRRNVLSDRPKVLPPLQKLPRPPLDPFEVFTHLGASLHSHAGFDKVPYDLDDIEVSDAVAYRLRIIRAAGGPELFPGGRKLQLPHRSEELPLHLFEEGEIQAFLVVEVVIDHTLAQA